MRRMPYLSLVTVCAHTAEGVAIMLAASYFRSLEIEGVEIGNERIAAILVAKLAAKGSAHQCLAEITVALVKCLEQNMAVEWSHV